MDLDDLILETGWGFNEAAPKRGRKVGAGH